VVSSSSPREEALKIFSATVSSGIRTMWLSYYCAEGAEALSHQNEAWPRCGLDVEPWPDAGVFVISVTE